MAAGAADVNRLRTVVHGHRIWPRMDRAKSLDHPERFRLRRTEMPGRGLRLPSTEPPTESISALRATSFEVGRALKLLGIKHIPSYSPEGRGRRERVFGTLQGRLPQELHFAGIGTTDAANRYLREKFVPSYNAEFATPPHDDDIAFVPFVGALGDILCIQENRVVGRDNCVR